MTTAVSVAPSLDYEAIGIALSLLVTATAAVVAGVWRGVQAVKKSLLDPTAVSSQTGDKVKIVSATIVETTTLAKLTESNVEVRAAICDLHREVENMINELKQNRFAMQNAGESMVRVASSLDHNSRVIERTGIKL